MCPHFSIINMAQWHAGTDLQLPSGYRLTFLTMPPPQKVTVFVVRKILIFLGHFYALKNSDLFLTLVQMQVSLHQYS